MRHPWRDVHPLGWVVATALFLTALAGAAGAMPHLRTETNHG